jgi:hypothetical protein
MSAGFMACRTNETKKTIRRMENPQIKNTKRENKQAINIT